MKLNQVMAGKRIKLFRKKRGLSQELLAEKLECCTSHISYIENGHRGLSLDTLVAIANILHVSADELLVDSLEVTFNAQSHDFETILSDCTDYERKVIIEIAKATKRAMRLNRR